MLETLNFVHGSAMQNLSLLMCDIRPSKWAWSGSREQCRHCGLRKSCHSKSSVYRWYTELDHRRFVYDTNKTMKATQTRWVTLTLQLHNFDLFMICRTSSFCTVALQLTRFQLTWRIAQSLGDSWASCFMLLVFWWCVRVFHMKLLLAYIEDV